MVKLEDKIYKFRAYSDDIKDWVYGSLLHITKKYDSAGNEYDIDDYYIITEEGIQFKVVKDTICQSIGITDCTGKLIYNKDIIEIHNKDFEFSNYVILWSKKYLRYYIYSIDYKNLNKLGGILEADLQHINVTVKSNIFETKLNYKISEDNL